MKLQTAKRKKKKSITNTVMGEMNSNSNPFESLDSYTLANILSRCDSCEIAKLRCVDKALSIRLTPNACLVKEIQYQRDVYNVKCQFLLIISPSSSGFSISQIPLNIGGTGSLLLENKRAIKNIYATNNVLDMHSKVPSWESIVLLSQRNDDGLLCIDCNDLLGCQVIENCSPSLQWKIIERRGCLLRVRRGGEVFEWQAFDPTNGMWAHRLGKDTSVMRVLHMFKWRDGSTYASFLIHGEGFRLYVFDDDADVERHYDDVEDKVLIRGWILDTLLPRMHTTSVYSTDVAIDNVEVVGLGGCGDVAVLAREKQSGWILVDVWAHHLRKWVRCDSLCGSTASATSARSRVRTLFYVSSFCVWSLDNEEYGDGHVLVVAAATSDGIQHYPYWMLMWRDSQLHITGKGQIEAESNTCQFALAKQATSTRRSLV